MTVYDAVAINNTLYFLSKHYAALLAYDFDSKETIIVHRFWEYGLYQELVCSSIMKFNEYIVCAPGKGNCFYEYNTCTREMQKIVFSNDEYKKPNYSDRIKFSYGCSIGKELFFVGLDSLDVVRINALEGKGVKYELDHYNVLSKYNLNRLTFLGAVKEEKIIFPVMEIPWMIVFDTLNGNISLMDSDGLCAGGICYIDDEDKYMFPWKGAYLYKCKNKKRIEFKEEFSGIDSLRNVLKIFSTPKGICVIPYRGNMVLFINPQTNNIDYKYDVSHFYKDLTFDAAGIIEDRFIWASSDNAKCLITFNVNDGKETDLVIPRPYNEIDFRYNHDIDGLMIKETTGNLCLNDFIGLIKS